MNDLFERIIKNKGPLGKWASIAEGYFVFPKLEGPIANRMKFNGKEVITWSVNDYLGLANNPEVRDIDSEAAQRFGSAHPMGARMMSGHTDLHEKLEKILADLVNKESSYVLNFGYQRFTYKHNDIESLEKNLIRASKVANKTGGGILVISEGVFGMRGEQGKLKEIVKLKEKYKFRFLVDDAHGFGTLGRNGSGTGDEQGVQDEIDVYFATFAKSIASTGAFIAGSKEVIDFLKYNMRSQMFAKSLQSVLVYGIIKRIEMMKSRSEFKNKLWKNVYSLQEGLKNRGFDIGNTQSCVTPVYLKGSIPEAMVLVKDLRENYGIFCSIVVYPVIPKGLILLRLIPTASHTIKDIEITLDAFSSIREKLQNGTYKTMSEAIPAL